LRRLVGDIAKDPTKASTVSSGAFLLLRSGFLAGHHDALLIQRMKARRNRPSLVRTFAAFRKTQEPGGPSGTSCFKTQLVMPEQRKKKNDRKRNSEQPKQRTSTETHVSLHVLMTARTTCDERDGSSDATR
jgi:hypothetical protein